MWQHKLLLRLQTKGFGIGFVCPFAAYHARSAVCARAEGRGDARRENSSTRSMQTAGGGRASRRGRVATSEQSAWRGRAKGASRGSESGEQTELEASDGVADKGGSVRDML